MEFSTILVALFVVLLVAWLSRQGRAAGLPPGPPCWPVFGSIFSMKESMLHLQLAEWRKTYGDVYTFVIGSTPTVVLNGYDAIKDALVGHGQQFAGRPDIGSKARAKSYSPSFPTLGIMDMTTSEEWKRQRGTSLQILRKLGYGKHSMEGKIQEEALCLMNIFKACEGKPTDPSTTLLFSVSNVICGLLYGERYDHSDQEYQYLLKTVREVITLFTEEAEGEYLWFYKFKPSYNKVLQDFDRCCKALIAFNQKKIDERRERMDKEGCEEPRDFIEGYLKELKPNSRGERKMAEDWLIGILNDFYIAGADTTATTLNWAILLMAARQDVQQKIQEELDQVVGENHGDISLDLRAKCPYIEATIREVQRFAAIKPIALLHATTTDVNFRGYQIAKGTDVMLNFYSVLHDPEAFPEPHILKPERFLDSEGKTVRHEQWVPFSMGRRVCLGEQLARQELFVFFSTLLQHFSIKLPDGVTADLEPLEDTFLKAKPHEIIFEPRVK